MKKRRWWLAGLAVVLALAGGIHLLSKALCFQLIGDVVCRVETERKVVALSFDDGPTPEGVDAVLPILREHDVEATFFLLGKLMERHPDEAAKLIAAGHELGNHSWNHEQNLFRSRSFYRDEVVRTQTLLAEYGSHSTLFRPPFGKRLIGLPLEVDAAGYTTIMWDVADRAGRYPEPGDFARDIIDRVEPGSIILIHPMYRHNQTARDALPLILQGLQERGFEIVTVSELLEIREGAS